MAGWTPMASEIRTQRLHLGPWQDTDLDRYEAMVHERDPRTAAAPRDGQPSREVLLAEVREQPVSFAATGLGVLAVRRAEKFAGYCGLVVGRASLDEPELAFELLRSFHGQGIATEAATAVVAAARATGRDRLWATVRQWNEPSFRVLDKLGFERAVRISTDDFGEIVWCTLSL